MRKGLSIIVGIIVLCVLGVTNKATASDDSASVLIEPARGIDTNNWPILKRYDQNHLARIAMPLGGIGTGTVSLGGRGDLRDWEIMNRPAKGFVPKPSHDIAPFFVLYANQANKKAVVKVLEGPLDFSLYEGKSGSPAPNHGLPRFQECMYETAYPLAQVSLSDADVPVGVKLKAFNPLIPGDADSSGIPIAVLKFELTNKTDRKLDVALCGCLPNFIGIDGWERSRDWSGDFVPKGADDNINEFRTGASASGIFMYSKGVDKKHAAWGTMALSTLSDGLITYRTHCEPKGWGSSILDFWDDFSADGELANPEGKEGDVPIGSLALKFPLAPGAIKEVVFLLTWHFPNRYTWTPQGDDSDIIGNYYTGKYKDAWDVVEKTTGRLGELETETVRFVRTFCESDLPDVVKESALFNVSTLRTQTCFRIADGFFFGWEGTHDCAGCCQGSCTHVWNYEQATAFLFGELAMKMREIEFAYATGENGLISFRVNLPLTRAQGFAKAAADGQMGCIMKIYRDWQLSGDNEKLKKLWPNVKKALAFCWIEGGWDANKDGVMEGCQHNTMDVEYYGPNPQMGIWYLGALRATEEMARYLGEEEYAQTCRKLFENGSKWIDNNLFNGEYYEHKVLPPKDASEIDPSLRVGMGAEDVTRPDYQLASGCLVDQLVGQFVAHVCGLGYLTDSENIKRTLASIMKYNYRANMRNHFNCMRSYALGDESALLMASYPHHRPENPFPYFTEVMTGFEYCAAVGMLYEGQLSNGLKCIENIRARFDGVKRNPFDEAECGHHYARAMASWAAVLALTGFHYSAVEKSMTFANQDGTFFWSNGYAWGNCSLETKNTGKEIELSVLHGRLELSKFTLSDFGQKRFDKPLKMNTRQKAKFHIAGGKH